MGLKVIGAGLGRTGTLSLKIALEYLGFGPCYHAMEVGASARRSLPLWIDAIDGKPDWNAIFDGYGATVDYPGCCFWKALLAHAPAAKVILTVRGADSWFESVHQTIFSAQKGVPLFGESGQALSTFLRRDFGDKIDDRSFMVDYFERWNQAVMAAVPAERLLVLSLEDGWAPLCEFLGVDVPEVPYPRLHGRAAGTDKRTLPLDPVQREARLRAYLDGLAREVIRPDAFRDTNPQM